MLRWPIHLIYDNLFGYTKQTMIFTVSPAILSTNSDFRMSNTSGNNFSLNPPMIQCVDIDRPNNKNPAYPERLLRIPGDNHLSAKHNPNRHLLRGGGWWPGELIHYKERVTNQLLTKNAG